MLKRIRQREVSLECRLERCISGLREQNLKNYKELRSGKNRRRINEGNEVQYD